MSSRPTLTNDRFNSLRSVPSVKKLELCTDLQFRQQIEKQGTKYQTLLNQLLRQALKDSASMAKRLKHLEEAVFRKIAG